MEPLYVFLHIPKTGGTTIRDNVEANLGDKSYLMLRTSRRLFSKKQVFEFLENLSQEEKDNIKFIGGHFVYYNLKKFFPDREIRYVTFFREPVSRMISFFNQAFQLYLENRKGPWTQIFFDNSKKDFSNWLSPNNFLSRTYLSFLASRLLNKENLDVEADFEKIKDILKKFYFLGFTENEEDFDKLYRLIGIKKLITHSNVSKEFIDLKGSRFLKSESSEDINKILLEKCPLDFNLYEFVKQLNTNLK